MVHSYIESVRGQLGELVKDPVNICVCCLTVLSSNIPSAPADRVYVSHLVRCARACFKYQDFVGRGELLTGKFLSQGYQRARLVTTVKRFYGDIMTLLVPTMWPFLNLFPFDGLRYSIVRLSNTGFHFH